MYNCYKLPFDSLSHFPYFLDNMVKQDIHLLCNMSFSILRETGGYRTTKLHGCRVEICISFRLKGLDDMIGLE